MSAITDVVYWEDEIKALRAEVEALQEREAKFLEAVDAAWSDWWTWLEECPFCEEKADLFRVVAHAGQCPILMVVGAALRSAGGIWRAAD